MNQAGAAPQQNQAAPAQASADLLNFDSSSPAATSATTPAASNNLFDMLNTNTAGQS